MVDGMCSNTRLIIYEICMKHTLVYKLQHDIYFQVTYGIYLIALVILMLNLLIAMLNTTYTDVLENANRGDILLRIGHNFSKNMLILYQ